MTRSAQTLELTRCGNPILAFAQRSFILRSLGAKFLGRRFYFDGFHPLPNNSLLESNP